MASPSGNPQNAQSLHAPQLRAAIAEKIHHRSHHSISLRRMIIFRESFPQTVDVLLVDANSIQIAGQRAPPEEFFHTFKRFTFA